MMNMKRFSIAIALALCLSVSPVSARAASLDSEIMAGGFALVYALVCPEIAYPLALDKDVWNTLVTTLMPSVSAIKEPLRQIALKRAPTINPTISAPQSDAVDGKYNDNSYSQIISFGDSMSDTGNMCNITLKLSGTCIPMAPNFNGRFTNGPVILEFMSDVLKRKLVNYAVGTAKSGYDSLVPAYGMDIGMLTEVDDFIKNTGLLKRADANALYVIWTGPDDFYKGVNMWDPTVASIVTKNIKSGMTKLYNKGARNFFIPLMPDLSITPSALVHETMQEGYLKAAHQRSIEFKDSLTSMLKSFAKQYPLAKVRTFDTYTALTVEIQKYEALGYNVKEPCYAPPFMGLPGDVCADPDHYAFWDGNHPTAWANRLIGEHFADGAVSAPLPSQ